MKEQNGITHIRLTMISIIILIIVAVATVFMFQERRNKTLNDLTTNMLLVQGKVRVISQENVIKKDERPLIGKKVAENLEDEKIKTLIDKEIIKQDEEKFDSYYIIDGETINELKLENTLNGEYYIVNYSTYEVIYTKGTDIEGSKKYKLSELEEYRDKKEAEKQGNKEENKVNEEANETQQETNTEEQKTENSEIVKESEEKTTQEEPAE